MISEAYFRRHAHAQGGNRELALIDVAQEYVLEHLRREGLFDEILIFKGGTSLRKFLFGQNGRLSLDLDFGQSADGDWIDPVLDAVEGMELYGVTASVDRRKGPHAQIRVDTPDGPVTEPIAVSLRRLPAWLAAVELPPMPFEFLDRGLESEFKRSPLPILDSREIAAEKTAAFARRRHARDLYDLDQLLAQHRRELGRHLVDMAGLKMYFDVVDENQGTAVSDLREVFEVSSDDLVGVEDLGRLRPGGPSIEAMLRRCRDFLKERLISEEIAELVATCSRRDYGRALEARGQLIGELEEGRT